MTPPVLPGEGYESYLRRLDLLDRGFVFRELVRDGDNRRALPPLALWPAMAPTLSLAIELRERMRRVGARGLAVRAAFRPAGGEADSRHKHNAALDLDLLPGDGHLASEFARVAALLWRDRRDLRVGLGTYAPDGAAWTNRVHLDTGWRHRCWQGIGRNSAGRYLFSMRPAALVLAAHDEADPASAELLAGP